MDDLTLTVDAHAADERELHRLSASLLKDIRALGVVNVARAEGEVPVDGKSGWTPQLTELVITGVLSTSMIATVGKVVIAFVNKAKDRSVKVTKGDKTWSFTGVSKADQHELAQLLAAGEDDQAGQ
ncbi:hypothetical protein ALI22I_07285 [Saccharothrix sp. ALI-22-I]|uniref:hypothetical protein n=1 Tax=Saccharothrix sp. ALI-22-I TaxID=1933778 RepID=UPI00097C1B35|nr:hypothetical protein [Saccharothrix sp. ALI-22-I]ONI91676.1 hypothetical protein ALI22I_07285 [Saccharothrix sp. ALI-22-I]